jgi:hypothetical protein
MGLGFVVYKDQWLGPFSSTSCEFLTHAKKKRDLRDGTDCASLTKSGVAYCRLASDRQKDKEKEASSQRRSLAKPS